MRSLTISIFLLLISIPTSGQTLESETLSETVRFVPQQILITQQAHPADFKQPSFVTRNQFLFITGSLLQGIKYRSPIDEFNAFQPFDIRAFDPVTMSDYEHIANRLSTILNPNFQINDW